MSLVKQPGEWVKEEMMGCVGVRKEEEEIREKR
jgi:hypothetical protein